MKELAGDTMQELYEKSKRFRNYVDRWASSYSEGKPVSVEELLEHELVRQYASMVCGEEQGEC